MWLDSICQRRRYEYVPPKPKTRSRDYRSTYQVGYADYMQPEFKLTLSHPQFKVDPENLKKPGGMKTPRERTLEQMSMDPQQIAADRLALELATAESTMEPALKLYRRSWAIPCAWSACAEKP